MAGWISIQAINTFSVSAIRLFCFLIIPVFTGVALVISKTFPLNSQLGCLELPFVLTWLLICFPHYLIISSFDLK